MPVSFGEYEPAAAAVLEASEEVGTGSNGLIAFCGSRALVPAMVKSPRGECGTWVDLYDVVIAGAIRNLESVEESAAAPGASSELVRRNAQGPPPDALADETIRESKRQEFGICSRPAPVRAPVRYGRGECVRPAKWRINADPICFLCQPQ
ncbi:MAG: hypothetical protein M3Q92_10475 [Actinomycetota bacterium]|nr:hypothetical protein [Actinomycetota bacterium]